MIDKSVYFFFVALASMSFFSPSFINVSDQLYKGAFYFAVFCLFLVTKKKEGSNNRNSEKNFLDKAVLCLIVCQVLSAFSASIFEQQDIFVGLIATLQGMAFVVYFALKKNDLPVNKLERIVKALAVTYILVMAINFLLSVPVFGTGSYDELRGGMRFRLPGIYWVLLYFMKKVNDYKSYAQKKDLLWIVVLFSVIILSLTRQLILFSGIFALLLFIRHSSLPKKLLILSSFIIVSIFLLPQISVISNLINQSGKEIADQEKYDNIRLTAFDYFAFKCPRNFAQILFGIGVPAFGKSSYGAKYEAYCKPRHLFREDVGWAGFYYNYGLIAVVILLIIFMNISTLKLKSEYLYLKYFVVCVGFLSIASAPIQITNEVLTLSTSLYMATLKKTKIIK